MNKKLDFKRINSIALSQAESVVKHFAPNGKLENREWIAHNPNRNDGRLGSFSINLDSGLWSDFATDDKGGDLVSYVAYVQQVKQGEAYEILSRFLGVNDEPGGSSAPKQKPPPQQSKADTFTPIYPPPLEALKNCPSSFYRFGQASAYWDYKNEAGALLMRVCRFDRTNSNGDKVKEIRPVVYGSRRSERGEQKNWYWRQLPTDRPLYGLELLNQFSTSIPAIIVEGEKACDATRKLFPDHPCLTWSGGSKAINKTDFSPLSNRAVWFWPDNDKAGQEAIAPLRKTLATTGSSSFQVFDLSLLSRYGPGREGELIPGTKSWPEKADAFDAIELGWRAQHFAALKTKDSLLIPASTSVSNSTKNNSDLPAEPLPTGDTFGYRVNDSGVWCFDPKAEKYRRVCGRLKILARSRDGNGNGQNWGLLVAFNDYDGVEKQWNIHSRLFATDGGAEVVRGLLDRGLDIDSHRESKRRVLDYLQSVDVIERLGLVYKMGWHGNAFVLPEKTLGLTDESLLFYTEGPSLCKLSQRGTLDQWKENVGRFCSDNPLALFAVSAAFAGPLVRLLGQETMGFHFYGDSSWGKSTLLNLACSVFGNPDDYKKTWRATDNALEGVAAAHSDMLLGLDEINQVDSRIIGDVVYMLGNGQGKHRAGDRGQARDSQHRWQFTFLSNGEKTLEQYLAEAGKTQTGGMEMRFIGIRATLHESEQETMRMGVFNSSHGLMGGAALSEQLRTAMSLYHGSPFSAFLNAMVPKLEGDKKGRFISRSLESLEKFRTEHLSPNAGGQVVRTASKFALVGLAGEIATHWGVTGWKKGEARAAAIQCFASWLRARGGEGNLEDKQMLDHVRHQLAKYGESKFKRWDEPQEGGNSVIDSHVPITAESWGFRREFTDEDQLEGNASDVVFYVLPDPFKKDLCKGFDSNRVARLLRDIGALELTDSDQREKRLASKVRIPKVGRKSVSVYRIRNSVLFGNDDNDASDATPKQ